jgi:hypothetical protein
VFLHRDAGARNERYKEYPHRVRKHTKFFLRKCVQKISNKIHTFLMCVMFRENNVAFWQRGLCAYEFYKRERNKQK